MPPLEKKPYVIKLHPPPPNFSTYVVQPPPLWNLGVRLSVKTMRCVFPPLVWHGEKYTKGWATL